MMALDKLMSGVSGAGGLQKEVAEAEARLQKAQQAVREVQDEVQRVASAADALASEAPELAPLLASSPALPAGSGSHVRSAADIRWMQAARAKLKVACVACPACMPCLTRGPCKDCAVRVQMALDRNSAKELPPALQVCFCVTRRVMLSCRTVPPQHAH